MVHLKFLLKKETAGTSRETHAGWNLAVVFIWVWTHPLGWSRPHGLVSCSLWGTKQVDQKYPWRYGVGDRHVHTAMLKMDNHRILPYSTGNPAQCYAAGWTGGEFRGEWIPVHVRLSSLAAHLKLSQHCSSAVLQCKIKSLNNLKNTCSEKKKKKKKYPLNDLGGDEQSNVDFRFSEVSSQGK